jgi:hypothetical protein
VPGISGVTWAIAGALQMPKRSTAIAFNKVLFETDEYILPAVTKLRKKRLNYKTIKLIIPLFWRSWFQKFNFHFSGGLAGFALPY